jgi:LysM repeat protein
MQEETSSPGRLLAPIALVVCAIAFFVIVLSSGSGDGGGGAESSPAATKPAGKTKHRSSAPRVTYTVKTGDTLGRISEKTGVPVDRLQELNPQLDPQALVSGQKIKLRE